MTTHTDTGESKMTDGPESAFFEHNVEHITLRIADAGGGRPGFGYGGNITDHATADGKTTLCGREVITDLADTSFPEDSTNPCKKCLGKAVT